MTDIVMAGTRASRPRKRVHAFCLQCRRTYMRLAYLHAQMFCSKRCRGDWRMAQPRPGRQRTVITLLQAGDPVPSGTPGRYLTQAGYVELRWRVAPHRVVRVLEHRLVAGLSAPCVHHINGVKTDNRPENLLPLQTAREHLEFHNVVTWDIDLACELYRDGWTLTALSKRFGKAVGQIRSTLARRIDLSRSRSTGGSHAR